MKKIVFLLVVSVCLMIGGCTTTQISHSTPTQTLNKKVKWGVVPLVNYTQTPQAGEKAAAITAGLLRVHNVNNVVVYRRPGSCKTILACPHQALSKYQIKLWARKMGVKYVMTGAVNEWRYKLVWMVSQQLI